MDIASISEVAREERAEKSREPKNAGGWRRGGKISDTPTSESQEIIRVAIVIDDPDGLRVLPDLERLFVSSSDSLSRYFSTASSG